MGKVGGYLDVQRHGPPKRDTRARVGDWREIYEPQPEPEARTQAGRCMDCGVPFCQQGCPLGNIIPDWNDLVYRGRWRDAWIRLSATNNFPEFTGRLCPAPCEGACVLGINTGAVTIEQIEKQIVERAFAEGWVTPRPVRPRTDRRVAVVGSGPAGLAAAAQLNYAGHEVVVFERADRVGGLLRYGIPDFKLEKWVIDRRVALLRAEGVELRTGVDIGTDVSWQALAEEFDAVLVAIGATRARDLDVAGRNLGGVHLAMEYLEQQNRVNASISVPPGSRIDARGKHVVVLGGGDTGSDCVGTAHRQGAASVTQIELMPTPPEARASDNPWPQWPMIFRTSSSHEEGGERLFGRMTEELLGGSDGRIRAIRTVDVELRRNPDGRTSLERIAGTEAELPCDLLTLALGFVSPVAEPLRDALGVVLDGRGNVAADRCFRTSASNVYVAGDALRGASLIVWAIADGREAARVIDTDLRAAPSALPTKGMDQPFGGR
ncbi:MAG: glutamate synthase subunit beta [Myxococcales bacterium]|nr:glutamate synthase subunit beta [Myxococcales bacterium]MCB9530814.1 glutamate synthase subunit beta [Myxococcales bacterium]